MIEKCPLCGGTLSENTCESCGYSLPRDEELAALYNLDPADYPQEKYVREIIPEHISEEVYPNRNKLIEVKVREEAAVQPAVKQNTVPMKCNMPAASPRPAQYVQDTQDTRSFSEFLWDSLDTFKENFIKCWTILPLCYFFPQCIIIYFVIAGVRLFSGEKVSIPFGLLTLLVAVRGLFGFLPYM